MTNPSVIDLFAGCGGMSLGFEQAGFKISSAFEYWSPAAETYRSNFKDHPVFEADLSTEGALSLIAEYEADCVIGGPPCQDFSSAGHRNEALGRADLTLRFMDIVIAKRPRFFLMENVPRIEKSHLLEKIISAAKDHGYFVERSVLDASYFGVPQARKRFILVGYLAPESLHFFDRLNVQKMDRQMTMRDYFGETLPFEHYFRVPRTYARRGVFTIDEPSMTVRGVDRPLPSGYPGHPKDSAPLSSEIRTLTARERASVQTFPESFKFVGSKTSINQMIGNAVPVELARRLALVAAEILRDIR